MNFKSIRQPALPILPVQSTDEPRLFWPTLAATCLSWLCLVLALLVPLSLPTLAVAQPPKIIYIQPLLPAPSPDVIEAVRDGLLAFYPVQVRQLPAIPMPQSAWHAPRARWDADVLLPWLVQRLPADGAKILGLTQDDIFTHDAKLGLWGVLGLGTMDGKSNVISTFRAKRGVDVAQLLVRIAKVAVHEVGHNFGLDHCEQTRTCLMSSAQHRVKSIDAEVDLCPACRAQLRASGVEVPAAAGKRWR